MSDSIKGVVHVSTTYSVLMDAKTYNDLRPAWQRYAVGLTEKFEPILSLHPQLHRNGSAYHLRITIPSGRSAEYTIKAVKKWMRDMIKEAKNDAKGVA